MFAQLRRTLFSAFAVWLLLSCCGFYVIFYRGHRTSDLSHAQLLEAIGAGANLPATADEARERTMHLIRALRQQTEREGRDGLAARTALDHIRKEASK